MSRVSETDRSGSKWASLLKTLAPSRRRPGTPQRRGTFRLEELEGRITPTVVGSFAFASNILSFNNVASGTVITLSGSDTALKLSVTGGTIGAGSTSLTPAQISSLSTTGLNVATAFPGLNEIDINGNSSGAKGDVISIPSSFTSTAVALHLTASTINEAGAVQANLGLTESATSIAISNGITTSNHPVSLTGAVSFSTSASPTIQTSGGNVSFTGSVLSNNSLIVNAGTGGAITASSTISVSGSSSALSLTGASVNVKSVSGGAGPTTMNAQSGISLGGNLLTNGTISILANQSGTGSGSFNENSYVISTSNATASAVSIRVNTTGGTGSGGAAIGSITTGNGGTVTINTQTTAKSGGAITQPSTSTLIKTSNVILDADAGIGNSGNRVRVAAPTTPSGGASTDTIVLTASNTIGVGGNVYVTNPTNILQVASAATGAGVMDLSTTQSGASLVIAGNVTDTDASTTTKNINLSGDNISTSGTVTIQTSGGDVDFNPVTTLAINTNASVTSANDLKVASPTSDSSSLSYFGTLLQAANNVVIKGGTGAGASIYLGGAITATNGTVAVTDNAASGTTQLTVDTFTIQGKGGVSLSDATSGHEFNVYVFGTIQSSAGPINITGGGPSTQILIETGSSISGVGTSAAVPGVTINGGSGSSATITITGTLTSARDAGGDVGSGAIVIKGTTGGKDTITVGDSANANTATLLTTASGDSTTIEGQSATGDTFNVAPQTNSPIKFTNTVGNPGTDTVAVVVSQAETAGAGLLVSVTPNKDVNGVPDGTGTVSFTTGATPTVLYASWTYDATINPPQSNP